MGTHRGPGGGRVSYFMDLLGYATLGLVLGALILWGSWPDGPNGPAAA